MNEKLHTLKITVEIGSFDKGDLPITDEEFITDVSGFFLERFNNVTVKATIDGKAPEPGSSGRKEGVKEK